MASVSIYTGGLPAKYGDTTGGVVAVETKTYFDFYNQKIAELSAIENMTKQQIEIQE
jgi:outer membrane receptor protein involved in Fe transport